MAEMLEPIDHLNRLIAIAFNAALIVLGLVGPVLASIYYFTRRSAILRFLRETPPWVVKTLRLAR